MLCPIQSGVAAGVDQQRSRHSVQGLGQLTLLAVQQVAVSGRPHRRIVG